MDGQEEGQSWGSPIHLMQQRSRLAADLDFLSRPGLGTPESCELLTLVAGCKGALVIGPFLFLLPEESQDTYFQEAAVWVLAFHTANSGSISGTVYSPVSPAKSDL